MDFRGLQGDSLSHYRLQHLEHLLHLLLHWPWCLKGCCARFLFLFLLHSCCAVVFLPVIKYHRVSSAPLMGSALGSGGAALELARTGCQFWGQMWGQLLVSSHRSHPCSSSATKTLPHQPNSCVIEREWSLYHKHTKCFLMIFWTSVCVAVTYQGKNFNFFWGKTSPFKLNASLLLKEEVKLISATTAYLIRMETESVLITQDLSICYIAIPFHIGVLKLESFSVNVIYSKK